MSKSKHLIKINVCYTITTSSHQSGTDDFKRSFLVSAMKIK